MVSVTKKHVLLLLFILACILSVQFSRINRPYTGHFASYQGTVMGGMAQNYLRENFTNLLYPKTNTIVGGERSLHLNQYPLPSLIAAVGVRVFGGTLEFWGRFQAILFNLLALFFLGLLGTRIFDARVGIIAVVLAALSPFSMIYGQAFMSESSALFFFLAALFVSLPKADLDRSWGQSLLSGFLFSLVLISRIHWLVFYPVFAFIFIFLPSRRRFSQLLCFGFISLILPVAWYAHTYFAGLQTENVHTSLYHQLAGRGGVDRGALFTSLSFYQEAAKTYVGRIFTPVIVPAFCVGFAAMVMRLRRIFWVVLIGLLMNDVLYLLVPQKILSHDFYLYGCFPFLMLCSAYGVDRFSERYKFLRTGLVTGILLGVYMLVSFRFFMNPIFTEPKEELLMVSVAKEIKEKTKPDDKIVVLSRGPGVFVYYVDRAVWAMQPQLQGQPMAPYELARGVNESARANVEKYAQARKNVITWLEYLRSLGANYLVVPLKHELDQMPQLSRHLETLYKKVSKLEDDFYLYEL